MTASQRSGSSAWFAAALYLVPRLPGRPDSPWPSGGSTWNRSLPQAGSEKLRKDLIAELRKLTSISLVSGESSADAILGGGGEIWIKGYRSLNPRSGRLPSDGTPVYGGYLSVELREHDKARRSGRTWQRRGRVGGCLEGSRQADCETCGGSVATNEAPPRTAPLPQPTTILKGAGATFPYPVYAKWFTNYRRENPNCGDHLRYYKKFHHLIYSSGSE